MSEARSPWFCFFPQRELSLLSKHPWTMQNCGTSSGCSPPELLRSPSDGIVVVTKAIPITEQGDCVFVVGTPIDRAGLL
jgi:hypothetical protein